MMMANAFDTDWAIPEDKRPTRPVPRPVQPTQSHSLRVVTFELGRMSHDDVERVRRLLEVLK